MKKGKFGQNKGKFCHKGQHLWLFAHPIKFEQFYKNSIFGRFNEHTPPPNQSGFAMPLSITINNYCRFFYNLKELVIFSGFFQHNEIFFYYCLQSTLCSSSGAQQFPRVQNNACLSVCLSIPGDFHKKQA